jgi:hypothetical protein
MCFGQLLAKTAPLIRARLAASIMLLSFIWISSLGGVEKQLAV